jgi:hypothetical protein
MYTNDSANTVPMIAVKLDNLGSAVSKEQEGDASPSNDTSKEKNGIIKFKTILHHFNSGYSQYMYGRKVLFI